MSSRSSGLWLKRKLIIKRFGSLAASMCAAVLLTTATAASHSLAASMSVDEQIRTSIAEVSVLPRNRCEHVTAQIGSR